MGNLRRFFRIFQLYFSRKAFRYEKKRGYIGYSADSVLRPLQNRRLSGISKKPEDCSGRSDAWGTV